jgi:hypothetical protein
MAFQSRTGKLMQGLFGRFRKKHPVQPEISPANRRSNRTQSQTELDEREFPSANRFDDDEETNWDDAEALADENNPIIYAQPIVPAVVTPPIITTPDLEDWDEALPAATVKNNNIQQVRRGKNPLPSPPSVDSWEEDLPSRTFSSSTNPPPSPPSRLEQVIGLWAATLQQLRRFLPVPIRRLSDAILTAIVVMLITVGIWIVDGLFLPGVVGIAARNENPSVVEIAPAPTIAISPEQAFIEAIQTQLGDITSQYPDDIIQGLQVDIAHERLIARLNPIWYLISNDRQDRVTDKMWLQAQANHFRKLEIEDRQGGSIARSPVVGQHMIILQRRQPAI